MSKLNYNHKNKRILQIIPNMEIGGAERTVLEVTSFLKKTDYTSIVLTSGGKLIEDLEKLNIEVIKYPIDKKNPFSIIKNIFKLKKIFLENKITPQGLNFLNKAFSLLVSVYPLNPNIIALLIIIRY